MVDEVNRHGRLVYRDTKVRPSRVRAARYESDAMKKFAVALLVLMRRRGRVGAGRRGRCRSSSPTAPSSPMDGGNRVIAPGAVAIDGTDIVAVDTRR